MDAEAFIKIQPLVRVSRGRQQFPAVSRRVRDSWRYIFYLRLTKSRCFEFIVFLSLLKFCVAENCA